MTWLSGVLVLLAVACLGAGTAFVAITSPPISGRSRVSVITTRPQPIIFYVVDYRGTLFVGCLGCNTADSTVAE